jgi:hypothetical protein
MEKTALNHYQTPWFSSRQGVKIKWNFAMMKSVIQLIFVLWCGVVTCAQDNGKKSRLVYNTTKISLWQL